MSEQNHIPPFEYFEKMQLEYIVADLRRKIYPELNNKKYWSKVMKYKEKVVRDMASRNSLPSIFSDHDKEYKDRMYKQIYNEFGLPNFLYKDQKQEVDLSESDILNYFRVGSEVKVKLDSKHIKIAKIKDFNLNAKIVEVEDGEEFLLITDLDKVARIL